MHDIKWIRDNPEAFDKALVNRNKEPLSSQVLSLDEKRRAHQTKLQEAQSQANAAAKAIGMAMGKKDLAEAERLKASVADLKGIIQKGEAEGRDIDAALDDLLAGIPNVPFDEVPVGKDEHDNVEVRKVGTPRQFNYTPKQHFELGEALGQMDFETAAKISGARFVILKNQLARLERALGQFMLDTHTEEHGYTEVNPPYLVKSEAAYGTGNLPKFEEDLFQTTKSKTDKDRTIDELVGIISQIIEARAVSDLMMASDAERERIRTELANRPLPAEDNKLYLIPTAEIPLTNMVREQILDESVLPYRFTALTPSFRSEAGSAGRDTRGMIRVHQFVKAEMVSITTAEKSVEEHERMLACAETILKKLELPFRTITLCTGDMGFSSRKTYDIEVWLPGQNAYREISSCSNCGDFQARRMNARYRPAGEKGTRFVHTLNGSGVAVGRALVAVLENYQNEDGTITVPTVLQKYMGGLETIG